MSGDQEYSDNPAFLLLKALIAKQKTFHATGDGNVGGTTIVCSEMTGLPDFDGSQIHIVDPDSNACDQTRDIEGATTGGTITVKKAFDCQITQDTAFIITGIRSTPVEVANLETWIKTAIGDSSGHTLTSLVTKWGDIARSLDIVLGARWDAAGDLGTDIANIIAAVAGIQNNTRFTAAVPAWMCKPDAGNEAFRISSNLYDTEGNMEDPENSEILVRVIKDDGTYITATLYKDNAFVAGLDNPTDGVIFPAASGWRAMEREAAGKFFFFNKVAHDATEESLTVEFGWTEGTKTNYQSRSTEIADVHGDLAAIKVETDKIADATYGLAAQNTYHWNKDISAYTGAKAGTYLKTLYDDWLNGGRLDLILDIIAADTIYIADGALPASPATNSLACFIASGGTALGTPLPASKSLYNIVGTGYVHDAGNFTHSIRRHLRRGLAGANATTVLAEDKSVLDAIGHTGSALIASGIGMELRRGTGTQIPDNKGIYDYLQYLTGNAHTRLGAPVGANISADIATNLAAINALNNITATNIWESNISAYSGAGYAGTYLKTLYDDWLNGGRLDLLLDACSTHTPANVRQSVCVTGDPANSIGKLLFDNLNAPVGSIPTTPTLQATWTDAKAAFLDENISAAKTLTAATVDSIRKSVCLTGDTASSIGKILYELYINRLTATRAGYLDQLDFDLDARLDTKNAGKQQIAKTTEDLNQIAATYDLFTGTTQDILLESLVIRMPNIVAGGALTSISIQTDDATPQVLISAAAGAVANLTAEAQLTWQDSNPILIKVGKKIQLTIAGGAHGVAYVCDIVTKVRAITDGGYLT